MPAARLLVQLPLVPIIYCLGTWHNNPDGKSSKGDVFILNMKCAQGCRVADTQKRECNIPVEVEGRWNIAAMQSLAPNSLIIAEVSPLKASLFVKASLFALPHPSEQTNTHKLFWGIAPGIEIFLTFRNFQRTNICMERICVGSAQQFPGFEPELPKRVSLY